MQTFLPLADFAQSAKVLDNRRCLNQCMEVEVILRALHERTRWSTHPAVLMWAGCVPALAAYGIAMCNEWARRGYSEPYGARIEVYTADYILPKWFGDERFHSSHRSNLLRKSRKHYGRFGWVEPDNLPYFWPTKHGYTV